ncbi:MAG: hypothetical protein J7L35_06435 [Anaerolineales bacterium]|nr:hypothetical protein [Anaerolineales bacterium]
MTPEIVFRILMIVAFIAMFTIPIYIAYLINYVAGGLLASNSVLTIVPVVFFSLMIINRILREEVVMREQFGQEYVELERQTGKLLPKIK